MSCHEDVLNIGKKLEKMIANKAEDSVIALDMLVRLKKLPMTLDVLQKTRIGMTVNNFRKTTKNEEVITLSKSLIKIWKKLLSEGSSSQSGSSGLSRSSSVASNMSKDGDDSRDSGETSEDKKDKESKGASRDDDDSPSAKVTAQTYPSIAKDTSDPIRIKCREMLAKALECETPPENAGDPGEIASAIEESIYNEHTNTGSKYKNRVRSRVSNLKDPKNPQLRENVLCGSIKPEQIAVMSSIEMANDAMKKLRQEYTKQAIDDHQLSVTTGTVTDLLKCTKCGGRKCSYNQVQTRSADEPMTTFVFCLDCGKRWKFC